MLQLRYRCLGCFTRTGHALMIVLLLAKAFVHNKLSFLSKQQAPLVQMVKLFSCLSFDSASCHIQRKSAQVSAICSDILMCISSIMKSVAGEGLQLIFSITCGVLSAVCHTTIKHTNRVCINLHASADFCWTAKRLFVQLNYQ